MKNSGIEWTHHTFNPWVGCEKISPACANCYAETWARRAGRPGLWAGNRERTTAANWRQPQNWDRKARAADVQERVFCASLADVFDNKVPREWRRDLFEVIGHTTNLQWLLLTKRIGNAREMLNEVIDELSHGLNTWDELPWPNVWIGATIGNQDEADRDIPKLLATPARLRFLSLEPLLGPVDLTTHLWGRAKPCNACPRDADCICGLERRVHLNEPALHWAIVGGESGGNARPMALGWAKDIVRDCKAAGVAPFVKQMGSNPTNREGQRCPHIRDHKGGDMDEWPEVLRVREFPELPEWPA